MPWTSGRHSVMIDYSRSRENEQMNSGAEGDARPLWPSFGVIITQQDRRLNDAREFYMLILFINL